MSRITLTPAQTLDGAVTLGSDVEEAVLKLRKALCPGSMVRGYSPAKDVPVGVVEESLVALQRAVCELANVMGFNPAALTHSVHQGLDSIAEPDGGPYMYWVQERATAGNWIDSFGSRNEMRAIDHADFLKRDGKDVRVVKRTDVKVWG